MNPDKAIFLQLSSFVSVVHELSWDKIFLSSTIYKTQRTPRKSGGKKKKPPLILNKISSSDDAVEGSLLWMYLTYYLCYKIKSYESEDELQGVKKIWKWLLSLTQYYCILKYVEFPGFL